jgi:SAM-dependent methyltransferase
MLSSNEEMLRAEVAFHDEIAERLEISDDLVQKLERFDTPAGRVANRLPRLRQHLNELLGDVAGKSVLIYGCGSDHAGLWFVRAGAEVDAIDISPESVENQKRIATKAGVKVNALVMDAHALDLPSDHYDLVYGNAVLHHLETQRAAHEILRVLRPGGRGIFRDVMSGGLFLRMFRRCTPFWRTPGEHPLTENDLAFFRKTFSECDVDYYVLSGLPYLFFVKIMNNVILRGMRIRMKVPASDSVYAGFDRIDDVLFRLMPMLKRLAWVCLIALTKRRDG